MKAVVFRADGSERLGMGHVMRCLAFAHGVVRAGIRPVFVMKEYQPLITEYTTRLGYEVQTISQDSSFSADVQFTTELASRVEADIIITDLCHAEALTVPSQLEAFHRDLKAAGVFLVCLAGGPAVDPSADIVVSPYYRTANDVTPIDPRRKILLGPDYFIFREEFVEAARMRRIIKRRAEHILIAVGGSDPLNLTGKVVAALVGIQACGVTLRVVVGVGYAPVVQEEISCLLKSFQGSYEVVRQPENMAALMLWADLAITGDGLTKYETAVTGTPSIMISRWDSERELNQEFVKAGSTVHLDAVQTADRDILAHTILKVMEDQPLRSDMSMRGKALVDGRGLERVMSHLPLMSRV